MSNRRLREFERLLTRTDKLQDAELIKINVAALESQLSILRNDKILSQEQIQNYTRHVAKLQNSIGPKINIPKARAKTQAITNEEMEIAKERMKHSELTDEMLELTERTKENVIRLTTHIAEDSDILSQVHNDVESIANGADKTTVKFKETKGERLGFFKVYGWLFTIIIIFLVARIIQKLL